MLDLVIRGGDVVDGTGAPRRSADVGIKGDRVVAVGQISDDAPRVIDATGKVVAPGFIDVHTHYDAQVFWDGDLTPSPLHGVTTVIGGNCGFAIAPLSNDGRDSEYLMRMLARVEGMPLDSLRDGVPWDWKSTGDYFAAIEGRLGINAGFMVGHSTIRRVGMGERAHSAVASTEELECLRRLLRDALEAGALGFSSSWARSHNDADGHMVPSRYASREELVDLCGVTGEFPGTSLEFIPSVSGFFQPWAVDLMADMSVAAERPLNWNVVIVSAGNRDVAAQRLAASDVARDRGGKVVGLIRPTGTGLRVSFAGGFVLDTIPGWEHAMLLPLDKKLELFSSPTARKELRDLAEGVPRESSIRALVDWSNNVVFDVVAAENQEYRGRLLGDIATEQGRDPWDVLCDIALADGLRTSFGMNPPKETRADWEARADFVRDPRSVIGASDAGAHLDMVATFNYTTVILEHLVRRERLLTLEEAVHLLTAAQAQLYGIRDRGEIAIGGYADLLVLDPTTVGSEEPTRRFDLPRGAGRLYAAAKGIHHVVVNGTPVVSDGELTRARTGTLLRAGRDTFTPTLD